MLRDFHYLLDQGNFHDALTMAHKALQLFSEEDNPQEVIDALLAIAEIQIKWGILKNGEKYLTRARELVLKLKDSILQSEVDYLQGYYFLRSNKPHVAIQYFQSAIFNAEEKNYLRGAVLARLGLNECQEKI